MGQLKRHSRAVALLCCLVLVSTFTLTTTSCAARQGTTPGTPQTPTYNIQQGLQILADANLAATKVVIELEKQGIIKTDLTREILKYNALVAQSAKSGTTILQSNKSNTEKAAAIRALMAQLPLPASVKSFIDAAGGGELAAGVIGALSSVQSTIALITANLGGLR